MSELRSRDWDGLTRLRLCSSHLRTGQSGTGVPFVQVQKHGRFRHKNLGGGQNCQITRSLFIFVQWPDRQKGTKIIEIEVNEQMTPTTVFGQRILLLL